MKLLYLIINLLLFSSFYFQAQDLNRFNNKGERTGKWEVYSDSLKTKPLFKGQYRNGDQVRRCYFYGMDGILFRREISRFRKIRTTLYFPDGTVQLRGKAKMDENDTMLHYYFYGRWKYFNEKGALIKYCYYDNGNLVNTVYRDNDPRTNDSLMNALYTLHKQFKEKNVDLLDSIKNKNAQPIAYEFLAREFFSRDSTSFSKIEKILEHYGYPNNALTGEVTNVPFDILKFAPWVIKEKYYKILTEPADRGDLNWKELAYYIDRTQIVKGEPQVYGTQFYYKNGRLEYYPSVDSVNLHDRRKKAGLE